MSEENQNPNSTEDDNLSDFTEEINKNIDEIIFEVKQHLLPSQPEYQIFS